MAKKKEAATPAGKTWWDKLKAMFTKAKDSDAAEKAGEMAGKAWDKTKDVSAKAWDKTKDVAEDVKDKVGDKIEERRESKDADDKT
jgi:hypothetical protein